MILRLMYNFLHSYGTIRKRSSRKLMEENLIFTDWILFLCLHWCLFIHFPTFKCIALWYDFFYDHNFHEKRSICAETMQTFTYYIYTRWPKIIMLLQNNNVLAANYIRTRNIYFIYVQILDNLIYKKMSQFQIVTLILARIGAYSGEN